jgi:hypothetical protein
MNNVPHVVVMNKYTPSYNQLNFEYATKQKVYNSTMNMFDYYSDNKKKAFLMLDYFSGKIGKDEEMNIIFEDGKYATKEQIEKRKKSYAKYIENSNIYKIVISFPKGYLEENVELNKFEQELAKKIIPMFLRKCRFDKIENMSYQFSLHTNTDHLHFHFSFAEKKPNYKNHNGKITYRYKGMLAEDELSFFKNEIEHYIEKEKLYTPLLKETNKEIDELKQLFNPKDKNYLLKNREDILLEDKIVRLGKLLKESRKDNNQRIKFNSIKNKEIISLTKSIKVDLLKDNDFKKQYEQFLSSLSKINSYFESISNLNNNNYQDESLTNVKRKYLDNYIYNAIVNHALYENKQKKLSEDEIIKEIIYKEYKNSNKQNRYSIISNFLSSNIKSRQFQNKYKVNQAVKHINDELEEAEKEFDKLFKEDKNYES